MKIVHINRDKQPDPVTELKKILAAKWDKRDRLKAEKEYGLKIQQIQTKLK